MTDAAVTHPAIWAPRPRRVPPYDKDPGQGHMLQGIDLAIPEGAVVGPSAAMARARATLIRALLGLQTVDEGQSIVEAARQPQPAPARCRAKERLGYAAQTPDLFAGALWRRALRRNGCGLPGLRPPARHAVGLPCALDACPSAATPTSSRSATSKSSSSCSPSHTTPTSSSPMSPSPAFGPHQPPRFHCVLFSMRKRETPRTGAHLLAPAL